MAARSQSGQNFVNYPEPPYDQPPSSQDSVGYGLWGCAGGILIGLLGGAILLVLVSWITAANASVPASAQIDAVPDVRLVISEAALNQFAQNMAGSPVQFDVLAGNQIMMQANTSIPVFGVAIPAQITGRFGLQITPQSTIEVRLIQADISGFELPPETTAGLFDSQLPTINQNLNAMLAEASSQLGAPTTLTGLGTTDTELWLEARITP